MTPPDPIDSSSHLCEKLGGAEAKVSKVPVALLKLTRAVLASSSGPARRVTARSRKVGEGDEVRSRHSGGIRFWG